LANLRDFKEKDITMQVAGFITSKLVFINLQLDEKDAPSEIEEIIVQPAMKMKRGIYFIMLLY